MLPPTHVSDLGLQNLSNGLTILKQLYLSKQFRPANLYAQKLKENISLKKITSLYFFNLSVISSSTSNPSNEKELSPALGRREATGGAIQRSTGLLACSIL
jgi:hypothetical protein